MNLDTARAFGRLALLGRGPLTEALAARRAATTAEVEVARELAWRGGRAAALDMLAAIDPVAYGRTRNHVGGAVTRLSPWIRHGAVGLAEVRDAALARVRRPEDAEKLVSELAWRDYWRQVHAALGAGVSADVEGPAMLPRRRPPLDDVPADVLAARTGLACIDAFVTRLHETGWLHNHERMWLASWLVHARGVRWQAGAAWFLRHLLDADPASNDLSWQWVAGTFSVRPYLFTRENLERFTGGVHCAGCAVRGHCDVEGTHDELATRFFAGPASARHPPPAALRGRHDREIVPAVPRPMRPLVWVTRDAASAVGPAAAAFPLAPRLFVLDPAWLAAERPALKRLVFLFECLADIPDLLVVEGPPAEVLPAAAAALACDGVAVAWTPCPRDRAVVRSVSATMPVTVIDEPPLCDRSRADDLRRFSRYWEKVRGSALRPTPRP